MVKYYVSCIVLFFTFAIICGMALAEDVTDEASVVAVGDNLIHPVVYNDALQQDGSFNFKPMYSHIKNDIQSPDLAFINQESPIGGDNRPFSGFKNFNTPSQIAQDVVETGFDMVNGANNHSLDQGDEGVLNHLKTWNKFDKQVLFTGIFNSEKDSQTIPVMTVNGIKVSLLSYTYGTNEMTSQYPYTIKKFNEKTIQRDVGQAKKQSDVVMVSAHWGLENHHEPNRTQRKYAQLFANEGVDVVIGTHPHVIQPIEWVKSEHGHHQTLVAYSLGNFLNGQDTGNEHNQLLGRLNFDIVKAPKGAHIENVKWTSMVNHYQQWDETDKDTRHDFEVYNLDDYNEDLAQQHGLRNDKKSQWDIKHLQDITKDVIDSEYLDEKSI
ncbi:capsule biosynthesis protein CapA [Staphylococcus haemolyticus]|uniref:CapA family protein n=1 Tax=Staphylococcus haemolyticus TaxID=1283 RepID=UPI000D1ED368|nr:CapA family protein [Staphylococcus haemolyticus]PTK61570.1 capsule biosynthesis protein CapA [Staphylococcus haemolyticus]PTK78374.1 capsule biosynthesis protein CapA [Staphylococcus haemolyticus]PTK78996.1 capsule biosynthesis protein CapA [Staphylococcus haemolyticus]PTL01682.1 capsule biosynthesis protein CapA [Staphylococcus haemolyticus]